jgi:hypothetical protein
VTVASRRRKIEKAAKRKAHTEPVPAPAPRKLANGRVPVPPVRLDRLT